MCVYRHRAHYCNSGFTWTCRCHSFTSDITHTSAFTTSIPHVIHSIPQSLTALTPSLYAVYFVTHVIVRITHIAWILLLRAFPPESGSVNNVLDVPTVVVPTTALRSLRVGRMRCGSCASPVCAWKRFLGLGTSPCLMCVATAPCVGCRT